MPYYVPTTATNNDVDAANTITTRTTTIATDDVCDKRNVNNEMMMTNVTKTLNIAHEEQDAVLVPSTLTAASMLN